MLSVLENPAVRERVPACSVENYHRLFELGALAENLELIRGAILEKMPQSPSHALCVEVIREHLQRVLPEGTFVRQEKPLTLVDSEPEPDVAVIRGTRAEYRLVHPSTSALIVEVAVSSEALDRLKLEIYAEAGVPECWLVFPESKILERHSDLQNGSYSKLARVQFPAQLESTIFPGVSLPPTDLF